MENADELDILTAGEEEAEEPTEFSGPLEWFWHFSQRGDYQSDGAQLHVLENLERLFGELEQYRFYRQGKINRLVTNLGAGRKPPRGIYIWGGVGRGKSLMMDAFFKVSRHRRKRRVHFHEFMREIHGRMRALSGNEDPLDLISSEIARELRLLCFDEFHVSDIADAMILGRLLELMIAKGVVLVMTSNYRPDDLYPNGLQRARFLPAIEVLKRDLDVLELAGSTDHRRRILEGLKVYHVPLGERADRELARAFDAMSKASYAEDGTLVVGGREIRFRRRAKGVIWFAFDELCVEARSQVDFLEIASAYHTVLVSGIPVLAPQQTDVIRRLTWMIDVFYDRHVRLIASAAAQPEELIAETQEAHGPSLTVRKEFGRTASRMREMQSRDYFSRKHASATDPTLLNISGQS
jgi:cell division protein ZapE